VTDPRRALPAVHALLAAAPLQPLLARAPRPTVADAARDALAHARLDPAGAPRDEAGWARAVESALDARLRPSLRPLLNATGVVLHTNLGRAPLADAALDAVRAVAEGYANLEYDVERGARGSRHTHCVALLRELTGAEDALVMNNCAAAMVLALAALAAGGEAIVSRGELVEIGGSFRVPDIMAASGARLREVGTTNRTYADDYARALGAETAAIVKVHRSNFAIEGFTAQATTAELAPLAARAGVPLLHDFVGLRGEPTARDLVRDGATLVLMSGDKLLGGPQAGIIVGRADAVARLRRHPLARAMRVDKLTLAALEATLTGGPTPTARALATTGEGLMERARSIATAVGAEAVPSVGRVGGGGAPGVELESAAVALPERLARPLRLGTDAVVGRVQDGRLLLDLLAVPPEDDARLVAAVRALPRA
jgi:L-seryl-tRNA(Ser) seleniumtransferase